jgi:hypothetical protein
MIVCPYDSTFAGGDMSYITKTICGAAMAAMLATPIYAGGKTISGAATTVPSAVQVGAYNSNEKVGVGVGSTGGVATFSVVGYFIYAAKAAKAAKAAAEAADAETSQP